MTSWGPPSPLERIGVGARLPDPAFRKRLMVEVRAAPDLVWSEDDPDVLIVDDPWRTVEGTSLVALLDDIDASELPSTVRALLPANSAPASILSAVRLVAEGLNVMPDDAVHRRGEIAAERPDDDDSAGRPAAILTPREKEVLHLLAEGASNKVIARALGVSVHTAKFHVASLLRKLGASGRLEAVGIGLRTGLLMI